MLSRVFLITTCAVFFSLDMTRCQVDSNKRRIVVVGRAIVLKHDAAVRTDDSLLYYLDGVDDWDDKFKGHRVRVTGKLVVKDYPLVMNPDTTFTAIPQQRRGRWKILEKPRWSLVE